MSLGIETVMINATPILFGYGLGIITMLVIVFIIKFIQNQKEVK